jgi:ABC-type amino acid transport substrate-binding protein
LLASINAFIKTITTDGTLDTILAKYFGSEA